MSHDDATVLRRMHEALGDLQEALAAAPVPPAAPVFVIGLPRSGTTLLMQVLTAGLGLGYVDNIAARFWPVPLVGARLSRIVRHAAPPPAWRSDFGKTREPAGPHEFSYFWNRLLGYQGSGAFDPEAARRSVDWQRLAAEVAALDAALGAPSAHKLMGGAFFIDIIAGLFPQAVFVRLTRDPVDVGCSIANGRLRHGGSLDHWWSIYTDDYETLKHEPWWRQIARQVTYFQGVLDRGMAAVPSHRAVEVGYGEFCAAPGDVLAEVAEAHRRATGRVLEVRPGLPSSFTPSRPRVADEVREAIAAGLAELA